MQVNETPILDQSNNETGCCARFQPAGWNDQTFDFDNKKFVRAKTRSLMHIPINMGQVFGRTFQAIQDAQANDDEHTLVLSRELSAWQAEHLFSVVADVPDQEMVELSGEFRTKVFEGPYRNLHKWSEAFEAQLEQEGLAVEDVYFFYTTCPKCAKTYGENYIVAVAKIEGKPYKKVH